MSLALLAAAGMQGACSSQSGGTTDCGSFVTTGETVFELDTVTD